MKPFEIGHLCTLLQSFAFLIHAKPLKINHEEHEGHEEFARAHGSSCHTIVTWQIPLVLSRICTS